MPVGETGKTETNDALHFRFYMKNDSTASLSDSDWDDLRSFGMYYGISWKKWAFEFTQDGLTNRGTNSADRGRIDEAYGMLSRKLFQFSGKHITSGFTAGAGMLALGNSYGYEIQKSYHAMILNKRPIPDVYDTIEKNVFCIAYGRTQLTAHFPVLPLQFSASLEKGIPDFYRVQTFAETGNIEGLFGLSMFIGYVYAGDYDGLGTTFINTVNSENGVIIGARFDAGILETGISYDATTSRQAGYLAISFPADKATAKPSQKGIISSIDFNVYLFNPSVRVKAAIPGIHLPLYFSVNPVIGVDSGTFQPTSVQANETLNYRFQECYGGVDLSRSFTSWLDLYAMGALGIRQEQKRTRLLEKSQILGQITEPLFLAEGGMRLFLPTSPRTDIRWGLDAGGGIWYSDTYDSDIRPYAQARLIAMNGWKQSRRHK